MNEPWIVAIEDLYGGFELVSWHSDESVARSEFAEWIGENESEPNYPDEEGRDCVLLQVIARGGKVKE